MLEELQELMNKNEELQDDLDFAYNTIEELQEENKKLKLKLEQKPQLLYTPFELLEKEGFKYVNTYDKFSWMFALNLMCEYVTTSAHMFVKHLFNEDTHKSESVYIYLDTDNPFKYYQKFDFSISISDDLSKNPLFQKYERVTINNKPYYYEKTKGEIS